MFITDEPGMGKTIQVSLLSLPLFFVLHLIFSFDLYQTIALLLTDYKKGSGKCTLVMAPTVAIVQWKNEIEKFTTGFKVCYF